MSFSSPLRLQCGGRWLGVLVLAAGLCVRPDVARAQEGAAAEKPASAAPAGEVASKLEQATKQIEQLNYPDAQQLLFDVVRSGKAASEQLALAYFKLGIVEAALDNEVEATDSFYLALMLQPSLLFPEGGSPKIRQRLNEARSRVTEVGVLEVRASVKKGVLDVRIDNDPLELIKRVEVLMTRAGGESGKVTLQKGEMRAEVEAGVETIQVALYDDVGNQLKVIDVDPASKPSGEPTPGQGVGSGSIWQSWGLWAGVAGAFALGGTYFIMESGSIGGDIDAARGETEPDTAEIARLEDNRDRVGLYGVVGLSMAGAAAVTAGAILLFGGDDKHANDATGEAAASLVPSLAPGHVGARFQLRF